MESMEAISHIFDERNKKPVNKIQKAEFINMVLNLLFFILKRLFGINYK